MTPARPLSTAHPAPSPAEAARVLTRAFLRASEALDLPRSAQGRILGVSPASLSRIAHERRAIVPESKEGELALLFVRLWRSLDALVGGDREAARAWLFAPSSHLGAAPAEAIQTVEGLVRVAEYLDALRGRL